MRWLELKIPPPLVMLSLGLLAWAVSRQLPTPLIGLPGVRGLAILCACAGLLLLFAGGARFHIAKTTPSPLHPEQASTLVTEGIYASTRNPMYLGFFFLLTGWVIHLGCPANFITLPALVWYLTRFQILPEERILEEKFGEAYSAYRQQVRRWI